MTTVTCDDDIRKIYTVPVGGCNQQTTFEESKFENKPKRALIVTGASISNNEPSKKSAKKPERLFIVPGAPTLFFQQGNQNSCILLYLESELHHTGDGYASEYIIRRKQMYLLKIHNKGQMHFCHDILWDTTRKNTKKDPIIVLRNGIHTYHMIYFGISLIIKLCV